MLMFIDLKNDVVDFFVHKLSTIVLIVSIRQHSIIINLLFFARQHNIFHQMYSAHVVVNGTIPDMTIG